MSGGKIHEFPHCVSDNANAEAELRPLHYIEEVKGYCMSNRGTAMLVDQRNYTYRYNRKSPSTSKTFWICSHRRAIQCMARVVSVNNKITKITGQHCHPPDTALQFVGPDAKIDHFI